MSVNFRLLFMNTLEAVSSPNAPSAIGPYSQGVAVGGFLFVSGQLPIPADGSAVPQDIGSQAQISLRNIEAIAIAAGGSLKDVVKLTVFMTDLSGFSAVNEMMASTLSAPYPARSTVEVSALPKGAQIEIEAILRTTLTSGPQHAQ